MPTQTIDDLKQQARERIAQAEAEAQAQAADALARAAKSERELLSLLMQESPLGRTATIHLASGGWERFDTAVSFELAGHAEIQARYTRDVHGTWSNELERWLPSPWRHTGFPETRYSGDYSYTSPDDKKQWRVRAFDRIEWDGEGDVYVPIYLTTDFEDLGDALLAAERAFVDPAQIDRQLKEANALAAFNSPVATAAPTPEPTTEERFMSVIKDLIIEYASQTRGLE